MMGPLRMEPGLPVGSPHLNYLLLWLDRNLRTKGLLRMEPGSPHWNCLLLQLAPPAWPLELNVGVTETERLMPALWPENGPQHQQGFPQSSSCLVVSRGLRVRMGSGPPWSHSWECISTRGCVGSCCFQIQKTVVALWTLQGTWLGEARHSLTKGLHTMRNQNSEDQTWWWRVRDELLCNLH